ncbi:MAG: argininosuccinate synthase [Elusimicrobiota bacterium]|jgi:argininosuccinate synthase|nr:argininosuccinate synthase [Elusimicrobiota bacterium]
MTLKKNKVKPYSNSKSSLEINSKDKKIKKVILSYSGGLDTSVIAHWLIQKYDCEVICYSADVGQGSDLSSLDKRAKAAGAKKLIIEDLKEIFAKDYIIPAMQMHALYENQYALSTSLTRPLIASRLVQLAISEKADAIAHGCTGKGNDQVRFEVTINALAPELKVLAPVREWELKTREEEVEYAKKYKIPIDVDKKKIYSLDKSLWGISVESGNLEDPNNEPLQNTYITVKELENTPNKSEYIELTFKNGIPIKINDKKYKLVDLIIELNKIAGKHGIGRVDMVENRLIGIKSREIYETPAANVLIKAHRDLESLVLDREFLHYKDILSGKFAELVYYGLWFSSLKEAILAFNETTQKYVEGIVRLKFYKGNVVIVGRKSKYSLYQNDLATYSKGDIFDQKLSKGFIELWGLPYKVAGKVRK